MKIFMIALLIAVLGAVSPAVAGDVATIDKDGLKDMLGSDDLVLLDVRTGRDWSSSEFKIKGAIREEWDVASWADKFAKDKTVVLYCA